MNSGQIVKDILKEKGCNQKWLAAQLGLKYSTLTMALNKELSFDKLIGICGLLQISIDDVYERYKQKKDVVQTAKTARHLKDTKLDK